MKLKIAHIVSTYPPYGGGMGNVAFYMVDELASRGHFVDVITPDYDGKPEPKKKKEVKKKQLEVALGSQISRLQPKVKYGNAAVITNIDNSLDDFDVVHLHFPFYGTSNIARRWKLRNKNKKLVITYHMDNIASGWKGFIFDMYAKYYTPKLLKVADIITVSSLDYLLESNASEIYKLNKNKWIDMPFGIDLNRFTEKKLTNNSSKNLIKRHKLDSNKKTVLFVGGMDSAHYFKGVEVLLNAIALLKSTGTEVQAILVGKGNLLTQYKVKAKALDIDKLVCFTGFISDEDLPHYYQAVDVTVLPSINSGEAFGIVQLESMACGTPVIASDLPGVRVLANQGGMTVKPNNVMDLSAALHSLITNKEFWSKKQKQVRNIIENKYTWQHVGDKLEEIYGVNPAKAGHATSSDRLDSQYTAKIIHGDKIARKVGYPTANIDLAKRDIIHDSGVYACKVVLNKKKYIGALVIMQDKSKAEVHLLDYAGDDIYGEELEIKIVKKVSDVEEYTDKNTLIAKIEKDIKLVRACMMYLK